ncbi:SMI1/KNR4 family protein [Photobacterium damselae]|uniref:SMI1/KNR4 family protein n=1 Tax=Photobacterium damselae TaxID=38293 RepID=UPI001302D532|nr:SMI1/KNR4 family protein [Photobacterium damselae]
MNDFNEFMNAQRGISESELKNLESLINHQLPLDFKEHYLIFNGGEPEHCLYVFESEPIVIQEFFPIAYGDQGDTIEEHFKELVLKEKLIPHSLLPFGRDPSGDFYCLDMISGKVTIYRAEYLPNQSNCITEVAESMSDFLNGLIKDE